MGKNTDKLYITHSEWSSSDAFSASVGAKVDGRGAAVTSTASFRRLPFNFCAASLQPFKNPVCTPQGTIFDVEVLSAWFAKHGNVNPVNGEPLHERDIIKLNFSRNTESDSRGAGLSDGKGDMVDPVTFKVFTDNTHVVAIRHGTYANVFAWETVNRMNIKAKSWQDLVDDEAFTRADIITLQDPTNAESRDLTSFKYLQDGQEAQLTQQQAEERKAGNINTASLGSMATKIDKAKAAVEQARKARNERGDVNRSSGGVVQATVPSKPGIQQMIRDRKLDVKSAAYTTGRAAASFTSTGLTPETSGERAVLTDEEFMLKPKRVKGKGYAKLETNLGDIMIELHPEFAPRAVWNFIKLSKKGYYKDVAFHRNIPNFMIQGGDPSGTGKGGASIWGKYFNDEFDGPLTHNAKGTVSMANKGKNTNSSQFFITYKATPHLDRKHTIFGKVESGLDILSKMEASPVDDAKRPLKDIVIKDVLIFVDPFEEFQKQEKNKELAEQQREETRRKGGAEDDKYTWTGKRLRADGTVEEAEAKTRVGKYLKTN